eukprot:CAMPEP_0169252168 /NCGR_PEP_ID=MMETSP1016-20121227/37909_1 /TAXON_ID=342587 /ORGANISM="Karlodinium micrum, Strain CCMP2283" /LENGTH=460 /DNA_ID=CAMNT_0009333367 /DNA_START=124 /DNA_END=1507 /DNA_ORIENTATION=-
MVAKEITSGPIVGGTLYVYDPSSGTKAWKEIGQKSYVDLAESAIAAGCVPKHKPHMVRPSPDGKHTAITYTGDQDFQILRNDERKVLFCPTVDFLKPAVFGGATHDGAWYGSSSFLLCDMTGCFNGVCGGAIHRFDFTFDAQGAMTSTNYVTSLGHDSVKGTRLTTGTKPISLGNNPLGAYADLFFVTDAVGAGSIMNASSMTWVKHFQASDFGDCSGGGGLWVEPHPTDESILLAQYGKQGDGGTVGKSCIFKVNMVDHSLSLLVQLADNTDAHGLQFCTTTSNELTVISTNRQTATLDVIKYSDGSFLKQGYDLNNVFDTIPSTFASEGEARRLNDGKLQPDVIYLHGNMLYMAARGPKPVSAVKAQNFFANAHPGMMALKIDTASCFPADDQSDAFILTCLERSPEITSDVHGAWGVMNGNNMELWAVDQAGTGSVQSYHVYSNCAAKGVDSVHSNP